MKKIFFPEESAVTVDYYVTVDSSDIETLLPRTPVTIIRQTDLSDVAYGFSPDYLYVTFSGGGEYLPDMYEVEIQGTDIRLFMPCKYLSRA